MPEKFIGAEVRAGEFTNDKGEIVKFNNLMMSFVKPGSIGMVSNARNPIVKVKNTREDILRVFGEIVSMSWLRERLDWYADVFYDDRGKVSRIMFYKEDPCAGSSDFPALVDEAISDYTHSDSSSSLDSSVGIGENKDD